MPPFRERELTDNSQAVALSLDLVLQQALEQHRAGNLSDTLSHAQSALAIGPHVASLLARLARTPC